MTSMRPSGVRKRIAKEHAALRDKLSELETLTSALASGTKAAVDRALAITQGIYTELRDHLELEDAILVPALREADAWGKQRAEQLEGHHAQQRKAMNGQVLERLASEPPQAVGRFVRALIEDLRADMEHEERDVLSVLRDDVLGIDVEDG